MWLLRDWDSYSTKLLYFRKIFFSPPLLNLYISLAYTFRGSPSEILKRKSCLRHYIIWPKVVKLSSPCFIYLKSPIHIIYVGSGLSGQKPLKGLYYLGPYLWPLEPSWTHNLKIIKPLFLSFTLLPIIKCRPNINLNITKKK